MVFEKNVQNTSSYTSIFVWKKKEKSFEWFESNWHLEMTPKNWNSTKSWGLRKALLTSQKASKTVHRLTQQKPFFRCKAEILQLMLQFPLEKNPSDQMCYIYLLPCGWYQRKFGMYLIISLRVPMHSIPPWTERWAQQKTIHFSKKNSYSALIRKSKCFFLSSTVPPAFLDPRYSSRTGITILCHDAGSRILVQTRLDGSNKLPWYSLFKGQGGVRFFWWSKSKVSKYYQNYRVHHSSRNGISWKRLWTQKTPNNWCQIVAGVICTIVQNIHHFGRRLVFWLGQFLEKGEQERTISLCSKVQNSY